jgi:hypothetical protein
MEASHGFAKRPRLPLPEGELATKKCGVSRLGFRFNLITLNYELKKTAGDVRLNLNSNKCFITVLIIGLLQRFHFTIPGCWYRWMMQDLAVKVRPNQDYKCR